MAARNRLNFERDVDCCICMRTKFSTDTTYFSKHKNPIARIELARQAFQPNAWPLGYRDNYIGSYVGILYPGTLQSG